MHKNKVEAISPLSTPEPIPLSPTRGPSCGNGHGIKKRGNQKKGPLTRRTSWSTTLQILPGLLSNSLIPGTPCEPSILPQKLSGHRFFNFPLQYSNCNCNCMSARYATQLLTSRFQPTLRLKQLNNHFSRTMATSIPKTMMLQYKTDLPVPTPKEGQVLVKNDFIGINYIDT
jgi:hypothetical protein